jgi:hypothetical protein
MTIKATHYNEKQKNSVTTSVTLLFSHTTRACPVVCGDDEDDGAQEQEAPPKLTSAREGIRKARP